MPRVCGCARARFVFGALLCAVALCLAVALVRLRIPTSPLSLPAERASSTQSVLVPRALDALSTPLATHAPVTSDPLASWCALASPRLTSSSSAAAA